ncbi:MAG: FAD-dependent oxidoreductase, partial [Rhizobiales bacterium]|nr:FAD-dependent oxidoreductase [Hyphomicrobiales bacterium]
GNIACEHVVNSAGSYCDVVGAWTGHTVPIANMLHHYVITEPLAELIELTPELPVVRDPYAHAYLREETNGVLVGPYETATAHVCWEGKPPRWDYESELEAPELDRIMPWLERATERLPLFGQAGIKSIVSGAITHTPDGTYLSGPAPGPRNYWMHCGASIGICQGGGAGKYLAQWMVHGQAEINMREFDPRRFGNWASKDYTAQVSVADYHHMYYCYKPAEQHEVGRGLRKSSLYDKLKAEGAQFSQIFGWERPRWYDKTGQGEKFSFRRSNWWGPVREEALAVRSAAAAQLHDLDQLNWRKKHDEQVTIKDITDDYGVLVLAGPRAREVLAPCTSTDLSNTTFPWLTAKLSEVAGVKNVRLVRVNYVGELGWELHVPMAEMPKVYEALMAAGKAHGLRLFGTYAMNSLRMEKAYRGWGAELTTEVDMFEASMERFIRLDKTHFIGREPSLSKQQHGPRIKLVYLEVDNTDSDCVGNEPVYQGDRVVGVTTSGGYGHAVNKSLAFAYIEPQLALKDTALEVLVPHTIWAWALVDIAARKATAKKDIRFANIIPPALPSGAVPEGEEIRVSGNPRSNVALVRGHLLLRLLVTLQATPQS